MATVFVTGANGKLGRATCRALLAAGHEVRGLARSAPIGSIAVNWTRGDILDPSSYAEALSGCEAVIHYAAELREPARMDATNVTASMRLLETSRARGVQYFCFTSSISVNGSPRERLVREDSPTVDPDRPMTEQYFNPPFMLEYARTKAAAELAIRQAKPGMVIDIIRPSVVRDRAELLEIGQKSSLLQMFMAPRRSQYVLTEDLAHAICYLMIRGLSASPRVDVFNIADDTNPTYREIIEIDHKLSGRNRPRLPV